MNLPTSTRKNIILFLLIGQWCLYCNLSQAQSPEALLEKGTQAYHTDKLDDAFTFYQEAYQSNNPTIKIKALTGLVKTAVLQARMGQADSLINLADEWMNSPETESSAIYKFETAKAEFYRKNSRFEEALALHQSVVQKSKDLQEDQSIHAYALYYTGLTFESLNNYDSSLIYVEQAYELFPQSLDTTSIEMIAIYNGLGVCYYRANQLDKAEAFYLKSKEVAEEKLGPVSSDLSIALSNLSSISRAAENYHQAIEYSEQALKISKALKNKSSESGAYYSLGVYHYFLGDYGRTKDYMEACIALRKELFSPTHYSLIGPYEVLGIAHEEAGDYDKTLDFLRQGRKLILANYPSGSVVEGYNYENTAICFTKIDQLDSAFFYVKKANAILPRQLPKNDYALAVHYFTYSNVLFEMGQIAESKSKLLQSNKIYRELGMEASTEYALNIARLGAIHALQQEWDIADSYFDTGLKSVQVNGLNQENGLAFKMNPNTLSFLNEYLDYLHQKYQATESVEVLKTFEKYSDIYLDLSDKFRKQFIDPYTKSILIKDNAEVYDRNIGIYNALYQKTKDPQYLQTAYRFSEYGRTCLLRDLQDEKVQHYAGVPDSLLAKEQQLKKRIAGLHAQIIERPDAQEIKQELFDSKKELSDHIDFALQHYPRYHDLKFNARVPKLSAIQEQLKAAETLIEFMQDDTAYYALILQREKEQLIYVGNKQEIDQSIQQFNQEILDRSIENYQNKGQRLYDQLWAPLDHLISGSRVMIIPVGPLFYLNFETLPTPSNKYLIEDYLISYGLSISVLFAPEQAKESGPILAVAPGFEPSLKAQYQSQLDSLENPDEEFLRTIRQPWSLKLADKLKKQFQQETFTGVKATETNIKANIHKGQVLYFGTHAIVDTDDPLRSKLVLSKEIGPQTEDGYLHAYELFGLPLEAELAVLNACESGLGNVQKGEGMISLAYSIHFAGCPSAVMSLWKVDEKVSTQITETFLGNLENGLTKSEALRAAKLDYLSQAEAPLDHPFYWAGMVLMGKDGQVELNSKWHLSFWWIGGTFLLILGLFWYFRRK